MTFRQHLDSKLKEDTPHGDVARDLAADKRAKDLVTFAEVHEFLERHGNGTVCRIVREIEDERQALLR